MLDSIIITSTHSENELFQGALYHVSTLSVLLQNFDKTDHSIVFQC